MQSKLLAFAPLVVRVHAGRFAFPFYTPTKRLLQLNIEYKTVLFSIIINDFYILDIKIISNISNANISNKFNFWNVHGIMNTSGLLQSSLTLQETQSIHDSLKIPKNRIHYKHTKLKYVLNLY